MESLRKKLGVLREAQRGLQEDIRANAQLGEEVGRKVHPLILPVVSLLAFTCDIVPPKTGCGESEGGTLMHSLRDSTNISYY